MKIQINSTWKHKKITERIEVIELSDNKVKWIVKSIESSMYGRMGELEAKRFLDLYEPCFKSAQTALKDQKGKDTMTKSQKFYAEIILSAIQSDDHGLEENASEPELLSYAWERYFSEVGQWSEERQTRAKSVRDWFQGLALNVPYMNHDILERAKAAGLLKENATERNENFFIEGYWTQLAIQFIRLAEARG